MNWGLVNWGGAESGSVCNGAAVWTALQMIRAGARAWRAWADLD